MRGVRQVSLLLPYTPPAPASGGGSCYAESRTRYSRDTREACRGRPTHVQKVGRHRRPRHRAEGMGKVLPAVRAIVIRLLWVSGKAIESGVAKDDVHSLSFPSSRL
jgi:hypothetical protein